MRSRTSTLGAFMALAITFSATACGDDANSADGAKAQGGTDSSTAQAAEAVERFLTPPADIPLSTPLSKKPAAGKTIIVTENPQAVTRKTNDGLEARRGPGLGQSGLHAARAAGPREARRRDGAAVRRWGPRRQRRQRPHHRA
jgi:hypothetical protein